MTSTQASFAAMRYVGLICIWLISQTNSQYSVDGRRSVAADAGYSSLNKEELERIIDSTKGQAGQLEMNQTVLKGGEARMRCTLYSGADSMVVWMNQMNIVLFLNHQRIIDDTRFDISKGRDGLWTLIIKDISILDTGIYRCVQNKPTIKAKYYQLIVYEPAVIDRVMSSKSILADEGLNVSLICNASGNPLPNITWTVHRSDDKPLQTAQNIPGPYQGQVLTIIDIKRNCDDIYTCKAFNGFGNEDQHSIKVKVRFAPNISLPVETLYHQIGMTTVLICIIDAFPLGTMYWYKDGRRLTNYTRDDGAFKLRYTYNETRPWRMILGLQISDIDANDFGKYRCSVSNSKGQDDAYMDFVDLSTKRDPGGWGPFDGSYETSSFAATTIELAATKRARETPRRKINRLHIPIPSPQSNANSAGVVSTCKLLLFAVYTCLLLNQSL